MAENHHDLDRLYQPQPEEAFDELDHAAYDANADELWDDDDTADWQDAMDRQYDEVFHDFE